MGGRAHGGRGAPGRRRSPAVREKEDFKLRIEGTDLLLWMEELSACPAVMDHSDPEQAKETLLGKCRQWARAHKKREEAGKKPKAASDAFLPA